jgi:hypothetical protein
VISTVSEQERGIGKEFPGSFGGYITGRADLIAGAGISHEVNTETYWFVQPHFFTRSSEYPRYENA